MKFIVKLQKALELFNSLDPCNIPSHYPLAFLYIANHHSITYVELEGKLGLSNASASRVVNALGENPKHRSIGYGLVEKFIDPEEGRRYRVRLSKKGIAFYKLIESI